jgi:hypothetical protein
MLPSRSRQLGVARTVPLGQSAFVTRNGSVVVRKDYKVLLIDMSKPAGSGAARQPRTSLNAASAIRLLDRRMARGGLAPRTSDLLIGAPATTASGCA